MTTLNKFTAYPISVHGEMGWFEFETVEELLRNQLVRRWTKDLDKPFYRFSKNENRLIVESDNGKVWNVVGFIEKPELLNLPDWEPHND